MIYIIICTCKWPKSLNFQMHTILFLYMTINVFMWKTNEHFLINHDTISRIVIWYISFNRLEKYCWIKFTRNYCSKSILSFRDFLFPSNITLILIMKLSLILKFNSKSYWIIFHYVEHTCSMFCKKYSRVTLILKVKF